MKEPQNLWGYIKISNIDVIGIRKWEEKDDGAEKVFKEIIAQTSKFHKNL